MNYFLSAVSQIIASGAYLKIVESPEGRVILLCSRFKILNAFFYLFVQLLGLSDKRANCDFGMFGLFFFFLQISCSFTSSFHLCQICQHCLLDSIFKIFHKSFDFRQLLPPKLFENKSF